MAFAFEDFVIWGSIFAKNILCTHNFSHFMNFNMKNNVTCPTNKSNAILI